MSPLRMNAACKAGEPRGWGRMLQSTLMKPLPSLYLSHGSPMIAITRSEASDFLDRLGPLIEARFGRPKAALVVSPHSATREPMALPTLRLNPAHPDFAKIKIAAPEPFALDSRLRDK